MVAKKKSKKQVSIDADTARYLQRAAINEEVGMMNEGKPHQKRANRVYIETMHRLENLDITADELVNYGCAILLSLLATHDLSVPVGQVRNAVRKFQKTLSIKE